MKSVTHERPEGKGQAIHFVASASNPDTKHFVRLEPTPACSCAGFYYRRECRHLNIARERVAPNVEIKVLGSTVYGDPEYSVLLEGVKKAVTTCYATAREIRAELRAA